MKPSLGPVVTLQQQQAVSDGLEKEFWPAPTAPDLTDRVVRPWGSFQKNEHVPI